MRIFACALLGYLLGCLNPAYVIGRINGRDLKKEGSQNAGASNALLLIGKGAAVFIALFDIFKATLACRLAARLVPVLSFAAELAGAFAIIGHIHPFYLRFRGGKGTACLGGVMLAVDWRLLLILLGFETVLVVLSDYLCVMPITAALIIPPLYGLLGDGGVGWLLNGRGGWMGAAALGLAMLAILIANIKNIKRVLRGTELRISYLWRKDREAELARVSANEARFAQEQQMKKK